MFRRADNLTVTQAEHSRLAGELALLLGQALELDVARLAGAIALHDWPHFDGVHADTIQIGTKTAQQQRELVQRLSGSLPLDEFTELVVRLHWQRLSMESDSQIQSAINQDRIEELRRAAGLSVRESQNLDGWTDLCDSLAFYLARGEAAEGEFHLSALQSDASWKLRWQTQPDKLTVTGVKREVLSYVSLVVYDSAMYPEVLTPRMWSIACRLE